MFGGLERTTSASIIVGLGIRTTLIGGEESLHDASKVFCYRNVFSTVWLCTLPRRPSCRSSCLLLLDDALPDDSSVVHYPSIIFAVSGFLTLPNGLCKPNNHLFGNVADISIGRNRLLKRGLLI